MLRASFRFLYTVRFLFTIYVFCWCLWSHSVFYEVICVDLYLFLFIFIYFYLFFELICLFDFFIYLFIYYFFYFIYFFFGVYVCVRFFYVRLLIVMLSVR